MQVSFIHYSFDSLCCLGHTKDAKLNTDSVCRLLHGSVSELEYSGPQATLRSVSADVAFSPSSGFR